MGAPITNQQRQAIVHLHETEGYSYMRVAQQVGVSRSTVQIVVADYRLSGGCVPAAVPAPVSTNGNGYSRIAGDFRTFGAQYLKCPLCKFRWWNAYGAVMYCPRCGHQRPIVKYSPSSAG